MLEKVIIRENGKDSSFQRDVTLEEDNNLVINNNKYIQENSGPGYHNLQRLQSVTTEILKEIKKDSKENYALILERFFQLESKEDFKDVMDIVTDSYKHIRKRQYSKKYCFDSRSFDITFLNQNYNNFPNTVINIFADSILKDKVDDILQGIDKEEIFDLEEIISEFTSDEILKYVLKLTVDNKKKNNIKELFAKKFEIVTDEKILGKRKHKCSDCKYALARPFEEGGCDKVNNRVKLPLDKENKEVKNYPFIKSSIQTWNLEGQLNKMVVTECDRFADFDPETRITDPKTVRNLKVSIYLDYYDAKSVTEAKAKQRFEYKMKRNK